MKIEIRVPKLPESVTDAVLLKWHKKEGDTIKRNESLVDIETDKVVLEVPAPDDGVLQQIKAQEGADVCEDELIALLDTQLTAQPEPIKTAPEAETIQEAKKTSLPSRISPAAMSLIEKNRLDPEKIEATGNRGHIIKEDVLNYLKKQKTEATPVPQTAEEKSPSTEEASLTNQKFSERAEKRVPMTRLRARIAERLVEAQQNAAMLTTFNEVNMQRIMSLRQEYKEPFEKEHGIKLGFMSFFVKACTAALKQYPVINASVDAQEIIYHNYSDIGIAVSSPRGLVVPVLRSAETMSLAEIEKNINGLAIKSREGALTMDDLSGGTFTITNGGVFGSLMSTPIINPPQSAILGMHKIQERPMAENGEVVIRPMMYLALSYDHRIIDGRDAVQFLVSVKASLEDPTRLLLEV
ncbi:MAG TPA: 2-oxoglutarate dehydrogenase complex dihydrolipoyllysine-residue succinyltransferase [Gammaproteobacteria bacterium]|nr:2-oxoglutarate dehydrogenase complex dihydrolipoyllysine-residue succinyltransferase [Gammaproteobacteria bacterium]